MVSIVIPCFGRDIIPCQLSQHFSIDAEKHTINGTRGENNLLVTNV